MNNVTLGRLFFAIAMIASGVLQVVRHDFVRLVPKLPAWISPSTVWAIVSGAVLVCVGAAVWAEKWRRVAAVIVGLLLFAVLLLYLPGVLANPGKGYMWTNPLKTLALLGGAWLLASRVETAPGATGVKWGATSKRGRLLAAVLLGAFLVVGGVQHFVYADFVEQLVPAWMPGRRSWVFVTGVALVAGGVGVVIPRTMRAAAPLVALMIFLWVLLLHIPRALAMWPDAGEIAGIFEALAISGTALLVAGRKMEKAD
jgi:uncharacterized membrane protein